eukprot:scaffold1311_cov99-Cylindrotheca_fusiformis.AAC.6
MSSLERPPSPPRSAGGSILFFGYGPIVHEMVRNRRNIRTTSVQPAFLDGYRLSFEFGGIANIVRQRGYRVHGVLMTLKSLRDWKKLQSFDLRRRVSQKLVFHYPEGGYNYDEDEEDEKQEVGCEMAYVISFPEDVQETVLYENPALERLPQEGYLKLLAEGLQQNRICCEYISDEVLNIPFMPDRASDDYFTFPFAPSVGKISHSTYLTICEKAKVEGDLYFVMGDFIFRLGEHDPNNPLAIWIEEHGHGKGDLTYYIQLLLTDPNIPFCERKADVTPCHIAWAENQLVECIHQHGLTAKRVFQFCSRKYEEACNASSVFTKTEEFSSRPSFSLVNVTPPDSATTTSTRNRKSNLPTPKKSAKVASVFLKRIMGRNR